MAGIFINYRGDDSQTAAALIDRELAARFGSDQVFLDSRSIPAGTDFVEVLLERVRACGVLLVVIGPQWLTVTDGAGQRRIDDPGDWLRREIVEAFTHGLRVIPVLLDGVELPAEAELPDDIAGLSRRQYAPLRRRHTKVDLVDLAERITETDPELAKIAAQHRPDAKPLPQQLPAAVSHFVGRVDELARLTAALDEPASSVGTVVISAIAGTGGVGKTWLALHWAHQHLERFPDGQLFVNLRGFDPLEKPMSSGAAVRGFLDAFGVDPGRIPVELDAQIGLYRSLVAGKRMLIVLDNARDSAQITDLLPGSPSCTVLVTSRDWLAGLITGHGAHRLVLNVLEEDEARDLLIRRLGRERIEAEPDAVAALLAYCAGLPLALGIVAARAQAHPGFPLAAVAGELRDEATRLGALDEGPASSLPVVLSWSYDNLDTEQARVFGLLGIAPGPDISLAAAASLVGLPMAETRAVLRGLERVSLVEEPVHGRYRMHDLIKLYAAECVKRDQTEQQRKAALRSVVDFYLHTAYVGDRLLDPHRDPIEIGLPVAGCPPYLLPDQAAAWAWFEAEHFCLLAAQRVAIDLRWHPKIWQLAWALDTYYQRRGHLHEQLATWQAGLAAAQNGTEPDVLSRAYRRLGDSCLRAGRFADALDQLSHALAVAQEADNRLAQAHTHQILTVAWHQQGDDRRALEHATNALQLFPGLNRPEWQAEALNWAGWLQARLGHYQQGRAHCEAALAICRHHHFRGGEASALDSLGDIARHTGQYDQALDYYHQALTLIRSLRDTYSEVDILDCLGQTRVALNQHDQAHAVWREALKLCQEQGRVEDAKRIKELLGEGHDAAEA